LLNFDSDINRLYGQKLNVKFLSTLGFVS
jgi:hypothetical protein